MKKPHILIVDDEVRLRMALKEWFYANGFEVDDAENGKEAVTKCESHKYDVITMDLDMPIMNGPDAIAAINDMQPEIPIIVLTGMYLERDDIPREAVARILTKPIPLKELSKNVNEVMINS